MKCLNDCINGSETNNNNNNNNWLGFSLSPHFKMEVTSSDSSQPPPQPHHHHFNHQNQSHPPSSTATTTTQTSFYSSSSSHFNTSNPLCFGENTGFHTPLSVMPLKSDGSLCIMEALRRSQTQGLFVFIFSFCSLNFFLLGQ